PKGIERWNGHCGKAHRYYGSLPHPGQSTGTGYIRGADFSNANLANANLGEPVDRCGFAGANLQGCQLYLSNCELNGANIDGVVSLNLVGCTAENVDFRRVAARDLHIDSSNLSGSCFAKLAGRNLLFRNCQLNGADFSGLKEPLSVQCFNCSMLNA